MPAPLLPPAPRVMQVLPGSQPGVFLSPYGIAQALAMVLHGVEPGGESDLQLRAVVFGGGLGGGGGGGLQLPLEALSTQLQALHSGLVKVRWCTRVCVCV